MADLKTTGDRPTWQDYVWLKRLTVVLEESDWEASDCRTSAESLISRLIRLDFNHQRFLAYCYRMLKHKTKEHPGKTAKLDELLRYRTLVVQHAPMTILRYDRYAEPLVKQLCNWIDAEITLIRETEPDDKLNTLANPHKFNY